MLEGHEINIFDACVVGIMLLSCLFAFFRGFVREVLSLGAWIGAALVTIYYFPDVAEKLRPHFKSPVGAAGVATLGLYTLALLGFSMINTMILKFFKSGSDVGILDNLLGLFFGAFRGAFMISLAYFLFSIAVTEKEYPVWVKSAVTRPYVESGAILLAHGAPTYLREISSLEKKTMEDIEGVRSGSDSSAHAPEPEPALQPAPAPDTSNQGNDTGYSHETRSQLDRLIDSTKDSQ